ncbi:MAG: hypothetical protein ACOY46_05275 [Bacillota bacterium]
MTEKNFLDIFNRHKKAFLKDIEKGQGVKPYAGPDDKSDFKKALDWFEKWLKDEKVSALKSPPMSAKSFDEFVDDVLQEVKIILEPRNINIVFSLPGQSIGIIESWKCVKVFDNTDVYYRIGKTRPRKGPNKGQEFLVLDLVMDGHKKQVFMPLLELKPEIEKRLGSELERELPKVEATGKYRLKILLPIENVQGDVVRTAKKFAEFISVTKPFLNQLGVI